MATYRGYRTNGGEPMDAATRQIAAFGQMLHTQGPEAARALLARLQFAPDMTPLQRALEALASGQRDPALAADPALHPTGTVELALVLEALAAPA